MLLKRLQALVNDTGSGITLTNGSSPPIPQSAIALTAITYSQGSTNPTYPVQIAATLKSPDLGNLDIVRYMAWVGTKSARGWAPLKPLEDQLTIGDSLITAESGSPAENGKVNVFLEFAVLEPGERLPIIQPIPFQCDNGDNSIDCVVSQVSASATAQTIDIKPTQGIEYELTQAWFYAGASATVTMNVYDGTTAVAIASPSAGTTGDLTPAGPRRAIVGGGAGVMFRLSAGVAAAATTTGYIAFTARPKK